MDWPPWSGWVTRAVGQRLPGSTVAAFIRMGGGPRDEGGDLFADAESPQQPSPATAPRRAGRGGGTDAMLRAVARACRQAQRDGLGKAGGWERMLDDMLGLTTEGGAG